MQPDRRLLLAVSEVPRILAAAGDRTGSQSWKGQAARVEFAGNAWRIYHDNEMVGTLREFPDFEEVNELLTQWASRKAKAQGLTVKSFNGRKPAVAAALSHLNVIVAGKRIDEEWRANGPDTALLREAARSSVLFSALPDQLGSGDLLPARALAWLAVCGALAPPALTREACLLACLMDYPGSAYRLSDLLPPNDAVRCFARNQDKELADLARQRQGDREARLLWLLELGKRSSTGEWAKHFAGTSEVPRGITLLEAGTGLPLRGLDTDELVSAAVLACVNEELAAMSPEARPSAAQKSGSLGALEAAIDRACAGHAGPLLERDLLQSYFHTASYSALHVLGYHHLEIYGSVESSQAFAQSLAEKGLPPLADTFRQWYKALADNKAGTRNIVQLQALLQSDSPFGTPLRSMVYDALADASENGSEVLRVQALGFLERLDTRLEDRVQAASIARDPLGALSFSETLWGSIAECAGPARPFLQAAHASLVGDQARLQTILNTSAMTPLEKASMLESLAGDDLNDAIVEPQLSTLCRTAPEWDMLSEYIDYLMKRKRFQEAAAAIETWLPTGRTGHALDMTVARTRLAEAYEGLGQFETGLRRLEDESVDEWQLGAMRRKALLLGRLRRWDDALRLARDARDRYPDGVMSLLTEVQLLWNRREYGKAASELTGWPYPLNAGSWRWVIGPRFVECFKDDSRGAIEAAVAIIDTRKAAPEMIYGLAFEIGTGSPEAAHEILARVPTQGLRRLETLTLAYKYLKQARGTDKALEWMRPHLSEEGKLPLCIFAHQMKVDELLWDMAPRELHGEEGECYWLLRAAGSLRRPIAPDLKLLLENHFTATGISHYQTFGRYLLNRENQAAVRALATNPKKKCETYYYLGLKEQVSGRYNQAADYYLQCLETGQKQVTEYRWAHDQLVIWRNKWKSLAWQAKEDLTSR